MSEVAFNDPEARRKRQEALNAEHVLLMAQYAQRRNGVRQKPTKPKVGTIYFIGPKGGPVKIGFASRLSYRLRDLQLANAYPLMVHAQIQGPLSLEREYHKRFAAHRLHGEWFEPVPALLAEIDRLKENV